MKKLRLLTALADRQGNIRSHYQWKMERCIEVSTVFETYTLDVFTPNNHRIQLLIQAMVEPSKNANKCERSTLLRLRVYKDNKGGKCLCFWSTQSSRYVFCEWENESEKSEYQHTIDKLLVQVADEIVSLDRNWEDCFGDINEPHPKSIVTYSPLETPKRYPLELKYTEKHGLCLYLWHRSGRESERILEFNGFADITLFKDDGIGKRLNDSRVSSEGLASALEQGYRLAHVIKEVGADNAFDLIERDGLTYWLRPAIKGIIVAS
ncbi:MAG: hypothetical protein GY928_34225 [Colwellia sp.]|nr:hypothetical protein [Colwellia sp.]